MSFRGTSTKPQKGKTMRKFRDTNTGEIITEGELRKEFKELKQENPEEYDYSFEQYLLNCSETLDEIPEWIVNAKVLNSLADLPKIGERDKYRGLCVSVELYDDRKDYAIYRVFYLDGKYIDKDVDIAYWEYAIHKNNIK